MSAPPDETTPPDGDAPEQTPPRREPPKSDRDAKRPSPREMFPAEDDAEDAPPDVFDTEVRRSHREHKKQVEAFARLAKDLVDLAPHKLAKLELDDDLSSAVATCRDRKKGARIREQRRVATILRNVDARALRERVDDITSVDRAHVQHDKELEKWRERLLEGGDAALSEFVQAYPSADRQQLRQLVRSAGKDRTKGKAVHAYRKLLREIRALDGQAPAADESLE